MKRVQGADGSISYFNETVNEGYHSNCGALVESKEKFVLPLLEKRSLNSVKKNRVLDVCFGMGYNTFSFIEEVRARYPDVFVEVIGIDNDFAIIEKMRDAVDGYSDEVQSVIIDLISSDHLSISEEFCSVSIMVGDFREVVVDLSGHFDFVLFDPFSPKKCPEQWSAEVFSDVARLMSSQGWLATYSCAGTVRRAMQSAGLEVFDGPSVGRRAPSTLAKKK